MTAATAHTEEPEPYFEIRDNPDVLAADILVAEDLRLMRHMIGAILSDAGFTRVRFAVDGLEAMRGIEEKAPDLLLLDIEMPGMNGLDVCRKVKATPSLRHIPVIVQSGRASDRERAQIFACGANDYVSKPLNAPELVARVYMLLENALMIRQLSTYRKRVAAELEAARSMQQRLFPAAEAVSALGERYGVLIQIFVRTSSELGGDMIGLRPITDRKLGFYCLDVSGHGVRPAMDAARAHVLIEQLWKAGQEPHLLLKELNRILTPTFIRGTFLTAFAGIVDLDANEVRYASAGHTSPVITSMTPEGVKVWLGDATGHLIGFRDDHEFDLVTVPFHVHDAIGTYSDAVTETPDADGNRLGDEGLLEMVQSFVEDGVMGITFPAMLEKFKKERLPFLKDDLTVLSIRRMKQ